MSLLDQLNDDMKHAMKKKDKERLNVIRMVKASLQNEALHLGVQHLSADDELSILSRELKQRNDSCEEFSALGRHDLSEKLETEIEILHDYMPKQLTDAELDDIVQHTIEELQATKKDFGKVMGNIMPQIKGKADGSKVQQLVKSYFD